MSKKPVRCIEDVLNEYARAVANDKLVKVPGHWDEMHQKQELRDSLRNEYISLLPVNQRLALYMATQFSDSFMIRMFQCEICGIEDAWFEPLHKELLQRANRVLDVYANGGDIKEEELSKLCFILKASFGSSSQMAQPGYPYVLKD